MLGSCGPHTEPEPLCILASGNHADAVNVTDWRWAPGPQRAGEEALVVGRYRGCGAEREGLSNRGTAWPRARPAKHLDAPAGAGRGLRSRGGGGWGRVGQGGCGAPRTGLGEAGCPEAPEPQHWVRLLCPASERSARQHHGVRPLGDNFWPLGALRQVGSWGGSVEGRRPRGAAVTWVEASVGSVSFRCSEVLALRSRYENTFHPVCLREVGRLPSRLLVQTLGIWRQALPTARRRALGVHLGS